MKALHDGHRQRMRERFEREGLDGFAPHEVLELLLYFTIPRGDTNPIAHQLITDFGSLGGVMEAPVTELMKVEGVGEKSALLLAMLPSVMRRYQTDRFSVGTVIDTTDKRVKFLVPHFIGLNNEAFFLVCLDRKDKVLFCDKLLEGTLDAVNVDIRKIVEIIMRVHASSVLMAHNHTQGFALPSSADINATQTVRNAIEPLSVTLEDHIIVARDDSVSMRDSGYLKIW